MERIRADPAYFHRQLQHKPRQHLPVPLHDLTAHFVGVFEGQGVAVLVPGGQHGQPATEAEAAHVFSGDNVAQVLKNLRNVAAPGADGLSAQFFKVPEVRDQLTAVLRLIYQSGVEPEAMNTGILVAAYKGRGSMLDPASYRPLVISTVLHKLYAGCIKLASLYDLEERMDEVMPTQAGFLPRRSTMLNCFLLQHVVQRAHHQRQPLHVSLLDVAKAYDTVNHAVMLAALAGIPLPGHMLAAIAGMYTGLAYMVAVRGRLGERVAVGKGVKQGCPLSPLLYNLYVAAVVGWLREKCQDLGVQLAEGPRQPLFLYADDQLVAHEGERPPYQQGVEELAGMMRREREQSMNASKSVELLTTEQGVQPITIEGQPIPIKDSTVYLGLLYDGKASCEVMAKHRTQAFAGAAIGGWSALRAAGCALPQTPQSLLKVLHTRAEPAGLYGCELWGVHYAAAKGRSGNLSREQRQRLFYSLDDPLEKQRCASLRKWFRLPHDVPKLCLLHELGCVPLVHEYVFRAAKFFNRLLRGGAVWKSALQQNVRDGLQGPRQAVNWASQLLEALNLIKPHQQWRNLMLNLQPLDLKVVRKALQQFYEDYCGQLKAVQQGEGSRKGFYYREVGIHTLGRLPTYLRRWLPGEQVHKCMLFRLGCHHLRIRTGHFGGVPRLQRKCQRCNIPAVDDEHHCIHRCQHPQLERARVRLKEAVPTPGVQMPKIFRLFAEGDNDPVKLRKVVQFVAECYSVSREAFELGAAAGGQQGQEDGQSTSEDWMDEGSELSEVSDLVDALVELQELDGGLEPGTPPADADEEGPELEMFDAAEEGLGVQ